MKITRILNEAIKPMNIVKSQMRRDNTISILNSLDSFLAFLYDNNLGNQLSPEGMDFLYYGIKDTYEGTRGPSLKELKRIINSALEFDDLSDAMHYHGYDDLDAMQDHMWVMGQGDVIVTVQ